MGLGDSRKPDIGTVKCRCGKTGYGRTDLPFTCDTCTAEDWPQTVLEVAAAMNAEDGPDPIGRGCVVCGTRTDLQAPSGRRYCPDCHTDYLQPDRQETR